jgi:arylsulfatase A-like enzyme
MINRVILLSIDNLRADCISANSNKAALARFHLDHLPVTHTLDQLASQGTSFWQCFSAASYTTASHASILTGVFPPRHGVQEYYRHGLSDQVQTLFQRFKNAGYVTLLATDFPFLIGPNLGFTRSVDHFIIEQDDQVMRLLEAHRADKLFAFVHFGSVHNPFGLTSLEIDGDYFVQQVEQLGAKMGVPEQTTLEQEWIERPRATRERLMRQRYFKCTDKMYQQGQYDELMQLYARGIEYFDSHRFKRFIAQIEDSGLLDNALFALLADHGEEYDERAFAHYNGLWEGIINVPLIIRGPDIPAGQVSQSLCRSVDVAPTLLDLAGAGFNRASEIEFDGTSLRSPIQNRQPMHLAARGETWFGHTQRLVDFMALCQSTGRLLKARGIANTRLEYLRTSEWKLIVKTDMEQESERCSLFDISTDLLEEHDLAEQRPDIVATLGAELKAGRSQSAGQELHLESQQLSELALDLKDLGYLQGSDGP